jgi:PAS domain S-box-containing protein
MDDNTPLYNSRVIKIFLPYLKKYHPDLDIPALLQYSKMTSYEVEDQAHWFNQQQVDLFNEYLVKKTGKPDISKEAGRYATSSEEWGPFKQFALGFVKLSSFYLFIEKAYPVMSRGASVKARKLGSQKVEIVCTPKPGVNEKPYQCDNRFGMLESIGKLFTREFTKIEHPECFHKGDECCRYIISWENPPSLIWKRVRNASILFSALITVVLFFFLPTLPWVSLVLLCLILIIFLSSRYEYLEKKELTKTIEVQGDTAKKYLEEINIRYNNALLVQEIGQGTSTILDVNRLIRTVVGVMEKHLDFDRGMIMLANKKRTRLIYIEGYGYTEDEEKLLRETQFHLDNPSSEGMFVLAFKDMKPFLVSDMAESADKLSQRSRELAEQLSVQSLICVPIVYEEQSLGILAVDNVKSKRLLTQSDMSLLMGVAAQTAVGIVNAQSFQRIQESEKKYRELVENANSIIMRMDTQGKIIFFNEFAQRFFGYKEEDIVGQNMLGTIVLPTVAARLELESLVASVVGDPKEPAVRETENVLRTGDRAWIAWTYKPIFGENGKFTEILCIGNDITGLKQAGEEKRALEEQLQHAQRMEAIGTLAGGIAHDFNNILGAIIGYTEMAIYDAEEASQDPSNMEEVLKAGHRAKDLVQQILAFSRQTAHERKPILIQPIVKEALKLLRASVPSTIEIRQNIEAETGSVLADPTQIHQILMNLCTNASQAMLGKGGIMDVAVEKVEVDEDEGAVDPDLPPGFYIRVTVSDTGHGMDRETMERIFEPYFTTKEKGLGTGLGLAVVHGIVKGYGGATKVQSKVGKGTTFQVYFPRIEREVEQATIRSDLPPKGNERILFVDDEEPLVYLGKQMLERLGYQVEGKSNSLDALEAFQSNPDDFDLVITDMTMPNMTGEVLAKEIVKIRPDMPIILSTGFTEQVTEEKVKAWGVGAFAVKPLELKYLARTIRGLLDNMPVAE